tara:strand:+ start:1507 stop:2439 length:933 start_codon:yes stop_codon:yes gene_type:complete
MKTILITGCAGFIGSALTNFLLDQNYKLIGLDDLSTGSKKNLPKNRNFKFFKGNCNNLKILKKIKKYKISIIIHLAGQSSGEKSFFNPLNDFERNLLSTVNLLNFYLENKSKHFIYASSMSVYGNVNKQVKENNKCNPISFYGLAKFSSEKYIEMFAKKKVNYTILRLFNVYGAGQNLNNLQQGMVRIYLTQILKKKKLNIKGSLLRYRDFIYISDVINVIKKIINNKKCYNKIFNVGYGKKYKISKLIQTIQKKIPFKFNIKQTFGTPLDQFGIYSNNSKLKKVLRYNPSIDLSEGLDKFIKHLKNNEK